MPADLVYPCRWVDADTSHALRRRRHAPSITSAINDMPDSTEVDKAYKGCAITDLGGTSPTGQTHGRGRVQS